MPLLSRLGVATAVALLAVSTVHAQQQSVRPAPSSAPSANARAAQAAPNPSGLRSPFPAGISSGSGARVSSDPVAAGNAAAIPTGPGVGSGTGVGLGAGIDAGAATGAMGAAAAGPTARGPSQSVPMGSAGNPVEVARAFLNADANHDGELTRNEAQPLGLNFEELDRNFDGVITRAEYDDGRR